MQLNTMKKQTKQVETAGQVANVFAIVMEYTEKDELLIGSGCIRLTKRFARFGVSAHVLPGLTSPDHTQGSPLFILVGPTKDSIKAAVKDLSPGDASLYFSSIMKLPV